MSTQKTVFEIAEILEQILSCLDIRTLLLSQRVNHFWLNVIQNSPLLQRQLFYESWLPEQVTAGQPPGNTPVTQLIVNPLLPDCFRTWVGVRSAMKSLIHLRTPSNARIEFYPHKSEAWQAAFLRAGATWRRMLVCQPPSLGLGVVEDRSSTAHNQDYFAGTIALPEGLRMGVLYDFSLQQLLNHTRDDRPTFTAWWVPPYLVEPVEAYPWGKDAFVLVSSEHNDSSKMSKTADPETLKKLRCDEHEAVQVTLTPRE